MLGLRRHTGGRRPGLALLEGGTGTAMPAAELMLPVLDPWASAGFCAACAVEPPALSSHTPCGTSTLSASCLVACRRPRPRPRLSASSPAVIPAEGQFRFLVRHHTKAPVCGCLDDSEVQGPSAESAGASRLSCRRWRPAAANTARAGNAPYRVSGLRLQAESSFAVGGTENRVRLSCPFWEFGEGF